MAAYNRMGQIELRNALGGRGLIVRGSINELRQRLAADDRRGVIDGFLGSMSESDMKDTCQRLSIPRQGGREELFQKLDSYNVRKGGTPTAGGWLNTGQPTPDDRLGPPGGDNILGTIGSDLYFPPYATYIDTYEQERGTTENAFTFRYWRILHNPGIALQRLWPIHHPDCRIE